MELLVLLLGVTFCLVCGRCADVGNKNLSTKNVTDHLSTFTDSSTNSTDPAKDMYVIKATVYQVGILTNRTDNMTDYLNSTGNQQSVTFYHTNGTNVDFSKIPEPFLTNVTAQTLVGVAPIPEKNGENDLGNAWSALNKLSHPAVSTDDKPTDRTKKRSVDDYSDFILRLFKRDATGRTPSTIVKVVNGSTLIPAGAGIQSISLPPLLSLNNNLTEIPVPIPNTSVVHYAKVNTMIQKP